MFTGIITHLGKISSKRDGHLAVRTKKKFLVNLERGISVSINGICLTVKRVQKGYFEIDFMPETENKTNLKHTKIGDLVNLELPATPSSFLSGHILQGHIDGVSKLMNIQTKGNSYILKFSITDALARYLVSKGSIAINGISLTVIEIGKNFFTVGIIPYTWVKTMLRKVKIGQFVNIEVDIMAKYLERLTKK